MPISPLGIEPPEEVLAILRRLRQAGYTSYLCGGCVRDSLLGVKPKDYDLATAANPPHIESLFPKTLAIGRAFGVMLIEGAEGRYYEAATFRSDHDYADGRRPEGVTFSTPEKDAERRDFTMNALFYDPFERKVIDYVGGVTDIEKRLVRCVGEPERRFREDHLRLLRAVRFAARTGFQVETDTWRALCALAPLASSVAPERIAAETEAILVGGASRRAFVMLEESGLLGCLFPELAALKGVIQPPDFHPEGDVWEHTLLLLGLNDAAVLNRDEPYLADAPPHAANPQSKDTPTGAADLATADLDAARGMERGKFTPEEYAAGVRECRQALEEWQGVTLAWAGLLHDIGKPATFSVSDRIRFNNHDLLGAEMATAFLQRFRRPRRTVDAVYDLIRRHIHFSTLRKMRKSKLRRWLREDSFPMHLELHRLDCVASHRMLANWFYGIGEWRDEKAREPEPEALIRGGDIIGLGVNPGPEVGRLLRLVEDARLEGRVADREGALELVRQELLRRRDEVCR